MPIYKKPIKMQHVFQPILIYWSEFQIWACYFSQKSSEFSISKYSMKYKIGFIIIVIPSTMGIQYFL